MKQLLLFAVLVLLFSGITAQQVDSTTNCTICTNLLGFDSIESARNSCGNESTTNCPDACASALQNISRDYGCCFNAYYNSTNPDSIAAYALWRSCNVDVLPVCENSFPEETETVCPVASPTATPSPTMGGMSLTTPAVKIVAGFVLLALTLIGTIYWIVFDTSCSLYNMLAYQQKQTASFFIGKGDSSVYYSYYLPCVALSWRHTCMRHYQDVITTESLLFQIQLSEQNSLLYVEEDYMTIFSSFSPNFQSSYHLGNWLCPCIKLVHSSATNMANWWSNNSVLTMWK